MRAAGINVDDDENVPTPAESAMREAVAAAHARATGGGQ